MRMKGKKPVFNRKDCYSLDMTLSPIIHAGLLKFKEELERLREEDHPMRCTPVLRHPPDDPERDYQEWIDIVGKMAYTFQAEPVSAMWTKGEEKKVKEGLDLFAKYFHNLWW